MVVRAVDGSKARCSEATREAVREERRQPTGVSGGQCGKRVRQLPGIKCTRRLGEEAAGRTGSGSEALK